MDYREAARQFVPQTREDAAVRQIFLDVIRQWGDVSLTRECALFHFTSLAMVFDESFSHVLMAYHNIYQSWAWTGGHCDGETRPLQTAMREAREETGIAFCIPSPRCRFLWISSRLPPMKNAGAMFPRICIFPFAIPSALRRTSRLGKGRKKTAASAGFL